MSRQPLVPSAHSTPLFPSFHTSTVRANSGLSAQPLSNVCSTWLSIDPGIPSIALQLPTLNPVLCISPIVLVPSTESIPFARRLLPRSVPVVATTLAQLCTQLRSRLQARTLLCRSLHQRTTPTTAPVCPATVAPATATSLPPVDGVDFTFPASPSAHSICDALPWLLRVLDAVKLLTQTNPLRVFLISIPSSDKDDHSSALASAAAAFCSNLGWTLVCCTINTAVIGDRVSSFRWIAIGRRSTTTISLHTLLAPEHANPLRAGYGALVISARNCRDASLLALRADSLCDPSIQSPSSATPPAKAMSPRPLVPATHIAAPPRPPLAQPSATSPCSPTPFARPHIIARLRCHATDPPCFVFHPDHPMPELLDDTAAASSLFGHSFGLPFTDSFGVLQTRQLSWPELLPAYSPALAALVPNVNPSPSVIADLRRCLPPTSCQVLCADFLSSPLQQPLTPSIATSNVARCLTTAAQPLPSPATWTAAYSTDTTTASLLSHLLSGLEWTPSTISSLHPAFQQFARDDNLCLHHGRLVVRQSLQSGHSLLLIIVPTSLRRLIFDVFHGSPIGGHFGVYKTLFRIRMRFFWPRCRQDVIDWIRECAHCILTNKRIRRHSEVLFSWPVTAPMFVLHCDLWSPGSTVSPSGHTHLLSAMCDLTQFVVSVPVRTTHAHNLARFLFQDILLKVGMCGLIVVDAGSTFCGIFADACKLLGIRLHPASRGNHKAVSVERFFRYLNKAVTIASSDRGTPLVWVEAAMIATYAWNCSPIDGTDVVRSIPAMGREFKFPFDVALDADGAPPAEPLSDSSASVLAYIQQTSEHIDFARRVVELVVHDRRQAHRDRVNEGRSAPQFSPGDLVLVRVQVNSNAELHRVAKLSYQVRGPFRVLSHTAGSYKLVPLHQPTANPLSYPGHMLSPVPPGILPCTPVDSPDFRYLNHGHAPLPNPLKRHLNIEQYNEIWFHGDSTPTDRPCYPSRTIQPDVLLDSLDHSPFPSLASMDALPTVDSQSASPLPPSFSPPSLATAIASSSDRLFFISYTPSGTARPRWYLVRVDLPMTDSDPDCTTCAASGVYHVHFLMQHPSDKALGQPQSRWWPQWNRFSISPLDQVMEFGPIQLFPPSTLPDPSKFVAWSTAVPLSDPTCHLLGPFDFQPRLLASDRRSIVPADLWDRLFSICQSRGIMPPALSPTTRSPWLSRAPRKRTRFA